MSGKLLAYRVVISVIAAGALGFELNRILRARASRSWPSVDGHITRTTVEHVETEDSEGYELGVEYEYAVDGHQYRSTRVDFAGMAGSVTTGSVIAGIEAVKSWYHRGDEIRVFYDPMNPGMAVLNPGAQWSLLIRPAIILFAWVLLTQLGPALLG